MVKLNLAPQEEQVFAEILKNLVADLRMEIADTDSMEFREKLKDRKRLIIRVLESFSAN
ncbi:MAG: hypothetical protein KDH97_05345 [Calditrichaeota bacterium]|nr:hypothetical protein [Calditrichota bacterium]MCB9088223.1 hypothetical protein [Calditrichia bacterium]MCB0289666.1 hypothetical protein [Calditrichota bacterium]MCB0298190.1 hypothetical protein [Calditrichota bacterium]MCB0305855.1 hypothetical protein [Calditrichota bacterium]